MKGHWIESKVPDVWNVDALAKIESAGILICKQQHENLTFRERTTLKMHLMSCKLCQRFEEDMAVVQNGIDKYNDASPDTYVHAHLDEDQKKQITQELKKQAVGK